MTKEQLINEFSKELSDGNGNLFIGAGISKPSKLPDWPALIRPFAQSIGIDNLDGKNLPLIAQYVINENTGNRGPFINAISRRLRKKYSPNKYHELLSRTNVKTIWTTNYDTLLEDSLVNHVKDVKITDDSISRGVPDFQVEIIKMHGCIVNSKREELVITEADYEDFFSNRPATAQRLKMDLLNKSFLFLGYGYGDVNIHNIMLEARRLSYNATRQHYMVMMNRKDVEFKLWCKNLKRSGINVVTINRYEELENILYQISLKSRGNSVFITGSHQAKNNRDAIRLGEMLAKIPEITLLDGQSTGIMRSAARAFMEKNIELKADVSKRLKIFPNPYAANSAFSNDMSLLPLLKQWRTPLLKASQIAVIFDGGMGTKAEVEIAKELGCIIIPFSNSKKQYTYGLLSDPDVVNRLEKISPFYCKKAKTGKLTIKDVFEVIKAVIKN
jgi:hypothetical protein